MKHFILSIFAVTVFSVSAFAGKSTVKATKAPAAKAPVAQKATASKKAVCVGLTTSCGISGTMCCSCSTVGDLIDAALIIDGIVC